MPDMTSDEITRRAASMFREAAASDNTRMGEHVGVSTDPLGKKIARAWNSVLEWRKNNQENTRQILAGPDAAELRSMSPRQRSEEAANRALGLMSMFAPAPLAMRGASIVNGAGIRAVSDVGDDVVHAITRSNNSTQAAARVRRLINGTAGNVARQAQATTRAALTHATRPALTHTRMPALTHRAGMEGIAVPRASSVLSRARRQAILSRDVPTTRSNPAVSAADIAEGLRSRGEALIETYNAYPDMPVGTKFKENIGTGAQNEGPGFYSTLAEDAHTVTPHYTRYVRDGWGGGDNDAAIGKNLILSDGKFDPVSTLRDYADATYDPEEGWMPSYQPEEIQYQQFSNAIKDETFDRLREAGFDINGIPGNKWFDLEHNLEVTSPEEGFDDFLQGMMRPELDLDNPPLRWEKGSLSRDEFMSMAVEKYGKLLPNELLEDIVDGKVKAKYYYDMNSDRVYLPHTEKTKKAYDDALAIYSSSIKDKVAEINSSDIIKAAKEAISKHGRHNKKNAAFVSRYGNRNFVTEPERTFNVGKISVSGDANIAIDDLASGTGANPYAYNLAGQNLPATVRGIGGRPVVLTKDIIEELYRRGIVKRGEDGFKHARSHFGW